MSMRVVLASASPRRRELLGLIGIAHEVMPADVDESTRVGELPAAYVERVARDKAQTIAARARDALVIAADTTVVLDGDILGKPADAPDARRMIARLAAKTHDVYTGIAVAHAGRMESAVERVAVTFRALTAEEIDAYVATREPLDKAGAYGIQGFGATIVERVDGDYFSVMGLGLRRLVELMQRVGVAYRFGDGLR
ncbi:MAG TPA: nucleoside triphosphate pyrophosphatase [Gemmatimonadaceae bacterium]|nr:nucleoside triphosphate pyrophosphatase [Gemmatimonadaceae bacterium]